MVFYDDLLASHKSSTEYDYDHPLHVNNYDKTKISFGQGFCKNPNFSYSRIRGLFEQ